MKTATLHTVVPALCSALVPAAMAGTIALYTFENGGAVGSTVSTIPNAANPGTHDASAFCLGTESAGWGDAPCWTNNFPGNCVWSDASCTQIVARAPMSVHFSTNGVNANLGGCLDMAGLANAMWANGSGSFTVEFFWRSASTRLDGAVMSMMYGRQLHAGPGESYSSCVRLNGNWGVSIKDKTIHHGASTDPRYLATYGWRHWAVSYDAATQVSTLWFDYEPYGTLTGGVNYYTDADCNPALRFGARVVKTNFYTGSGCMNGEISCIRVSDGVLGIDDFMRMGVAAFYPLKDGEDGASATTLANSLVPGSAVGTAGRLDEDGANPTFSSDRPGRYIYASLAKDELLCENPGSLKFANETWKSRRGYVTLAELAGRLLMATREDDGATIECFFKKEGLASGNLDLFSFKPGAANYWRLFADPARVGFAQLYQNSCYAQTGGEALTGDGRWHHLAIVLGRNESNAKQWKTASVYLDYVQPTNSLAQGLYWNQSDFWNAWSDTPLAVGTRCDLATPNSCFMGKISAIRVTNKALSPDRFLLASDTADTPAAGHGFHWRFEEGTAGAAITAAVDADGGEKWAVGEITTYGENPVVPACASGRAARTIVIGSIEAENRGSAAMTANGTGTRAVLENKLWYGAPALHPESWTMELFVKAGGDRSSDALIAGRGRIDPSTGAEWSDWALAIQPDGRLALAGFRSDGSGGKTAYAYPNLGANLGDGNWHRIEVVYDGGLATFQVWADESRILDQALGSAQIDSKDARYQFGAGCNLASFGGTIDEVRFVGRALAQSEFAMLREDATVFIIR